MAESNQLSEETKQRIILEAIREVGLGATDFEIATQAASIRSRLRRCMNEKSLVSRVISSVVIRAVLEDCRIEESSQRYVVTFRPVKEGSDVETIRTDRRDSNPHVDSMISSLTLGEQVLVYKIIEETNDGTGHKVRTAPLILMFPTKSKS
ncbi:MAG: hypothetical protein IJ781_05935 [Atopobiaceae bacterium]|nr:hypothetical protein [Atopobiaceae bacterium]